MLSSLLVNTRLLIVGMLNLLDVYWEGVQYLKVKHGKVNFIISL